jgi:hypothetical protein
MPFAPPGGLLSPARGPPDSGTGVYAVPDSRLKPFVPGQVLTAEALEALRVAVLAGSLEVVQGCGLILTAGPAGKVLGLTGAETQLARIVSGPDTNGKYAWRGVYRKTDGTFADLDAAVSDNTLKDPAYELNSIRAVTPGTRVLLARSPTTGEWMFTAPPLFLVGKTGGSGVPAMSGAVPGSATVTLYAYDGTTLTATTQTVAAKNEASTAAGANKFVQMKIGPGGYPFLDFEDCP